MRVYSPPKQKKNTAVSLVAMVFGCALFLISYFPERYAAFIQLAAFGFWAFSLWVACRYCLTSYYYEVEGDIFRIIKVMGQRRQVVGNISMRTGVFLEKESAAKKRPSARTRFNYCSNFAPQEKYVYFFEWNGTAAEIIFEPSEEFAAIMREHLETVKNEPAPEPTNGWYDE
ncbi:MAG: hypothetical protein IJ021_08010 [Clostridia bacterium]|nr:hypothetical protein [Clostridia bacterium]